MLQNLSFFLEEVPGYVPDHVKQEQLYVKFMSKIAAQLSALDRGARIIQLDGFGQLGSLVGGERERAPDIDTCPAVFQSCCYLYKFQDATFNEICLCGYA